MLEKWMDLVVSCLVEKKIEESKEEKICNYRIEETKWREILINLMDP